MAMQSFHLEVYTQAKAKAKREAQQHIVEMILPHAGWRGSNSNGGTHV
jgi:hypothetical protein